MSCSEVAGTVGGIPWQGYRQSIHGTIEFVIVAVKPCTDFHLLCVVHVGLSSIDKVMHH